MGRHEITRRALGLLGLGLAAPAFAQGGWVPTRQVRIVVPFPPGGSTDLLARRLAERLTAALGQTVIVENRPGAGGTTGADLVAKSAPDGHTLLMGVTGSNAIAASLFPNLPYDPVRGFAPVSRVVSAPLVLVVNPNHPARDVAGYVAAARAAPGHAGLRHAGQRHLDAPDRRDVRHGDAHRTAARALSRLRSGDHRPDRRPGAEQLRRRAGRAAAYPRRCGARAGGQFRRTPPAAARGADDAGGRAGGVRGDVLAGDLRRRRHARAGARPPAGRDRACHGGARDP
jgi:hypothetical protein